MSEIPVYVRVRPLNPKEVEAGHSDVWYLEDASLHCTIDGKDASNYRVNKVFRPSSTNASVFSGAAQEIVSHALQGYSGTVFAYGQTASGKTHTMMGGAGEPGLVQTALGYMYGEMARDTEADYIVRCLAMEVYNERLSCLKTDTELTIKEGRGAEPVVVGVRGGEGASSVVVSSAEEATFELEAAMSRRHVGKTKMNDQSSRSHTIFRLQIDRMPKGEAGKGAARSTNTRSMLHLVDLAGAESMKKTGATGATAREGSNINKSLSALVRVIHCLTGGKGNEFIPFRDSKLTRLLKTSLGGNTKTAIVCCVTPASGQYDQTASTLRFAQEASKVKNDPKKCVLSGEIPPALRRTLQAMAEAQTAEAREEHKRDVAQLMEQMEALRQEAQQKEEIARQLENEREKRRAAESRLEQRGTTRPSTGAMPTPKRARKEGIEEGRKQAMAETAVLQAQLEKQRAEAQSLAAENVRIKEAAAAAAAEQVSRGDSDVSAAELTTPKQQRRSAGSDAVSAAAAADADEAMAGAAAVHEQWHRVPVFDGAQEAGAVEAAAAAAAAASASASLQAECTALRARAETAEATAAELSGLLEAAAAREAAASEALQRTEARAAEAAAALPRELEAAAVAARTAEAVACAQAQEECSRRAAAAEEKVAEVEAAAEALRAQLTAAAAAAAESETAWRAREEARAAEAKAELARVTAAREAVEAELAVARACNEEEAVALRAECAVLVDRAAKAEAAEAALTAKLEASVGEAAALRLQAETAQLEAREQTHQSARLEVVAKQRKEELECSMVGPLRVARDDLERKLKAAKKELSEHKEDAKQKDKKIRILEADKEALKKKAGGGGGAPRGPIMRKTPPPPPAAVVAAAPAQAEASAAAAVAAAADEERARELA
eukprot:Rhum_TRINITY_DN14942_c11_g1::Rhum_TRINITY_DN14942_c11_g1_i1::g.126792::m.126792/K11498/CENPE; centromeric protein E